MQKFYSLIIILLVMYSCGSYTNNENSKKQIVSNNSNLFLSDKMQDTLIMFINRTDSIPNRYNSPTFYLLEFTKNRKGVVLKLTAAPFVYLAIPDKNLKDITWEILKGGCKIQDKKILVYSHIKNLSDFINLDELSIEFAQEIYDLIEKSEGKEEEYNPVADFYPISERIYKIHSIDSLELLSKKIGKFEKQD